MQNPTSFRAAILSQAGADALVAPTVYGANVQSGRLNWLAILKSKFWALTLCLMTICIFFPSAATAAVSYTPGGATVTQNVPFSLQYAGTGGTGPYTFSNLNVNGIAGTYSMSSSGLFFGTITAAPTTVNGFITVQDSLGASSFLGFVLNVRLPIVTIAVANNNIVEDSGQSFDFTVTRNVAAPYSTTVNISVTNGQTNAADYTGAISSITILANQTTATFSITPVADTTPELNEFFFVGIAAGTGYAVGSASSVTCTITNDDIPSVSISVSPASVVEDSGIPLVYSVTRSGNSSTPTVVNITRSGSASTANNDYSPAVSTVTIPAGGTNTATINILPTADIVPELDETVTLTIAPGAGYTVGTPSSATGTILNDDQPNLTINDVAASEGDLGTTNFTFTVSLSAPAGPGGVTFDIATANGSATAGVDYVARSLTSQNIPAGSSTYTFTVSVNGDTLNEPSETFFVNVTNVTNALVVDGQGVGTITNDDPLPSLSINDVTVTEGNAGTVNATFTVALNAASGRSVSVNYATADGTAAQPTDYASASGSLTFTPGQTSQTITVTVNGDTTPEGNETFFVNLSGATNATISDSQGVGTITNDDVPVVVNPATIPNSISKSLVKLKVLQRATAKIRLSLSLMS